MGFSIDSRHVEGNLFNENGKWKYTVALDYSGTEWGIEWEDWDLWTQARRALRKATDDGTSGVTLREIPEGWTLVVLEPYSKFEHPIMVKG